jgi:uncharacterized protein YyaL (SSP411 family)
MLKDAFDGDRTRIDKQAEHLVEFVQENMNAASKTGTVNEVALRQAIENYKGQYDSTYGGLSHAPKFPSSLPIRLLLRYHRRSGDKQVLSMVTHTLDKMSAGGMYDQVGGGFHRYSVDRAWLTPHFEKMLYDNALLAMAYLEAYQVTQQDRYRKVVREILDYVLRDVTSPKGGFYSATDADSLTPSGSREEGYYFTWTKDEIEAFLDHEQAQAVKAFYAVTRSGNFEGRNILHTPKSAEEVAKALKMDVSRLEKLIAAANTHLRAERNKDRCPFAMKRLSPPGMVL